MRIPATIQVVFVIGWAVGSIMGAIFGWGAAVWAILFALIIVVLTLLDEKRKYDALRRQYPEAKTRD